MLLLEKHRKARGISQKALAHEIGVSEITIIRWEKGQTSPTVAQVAKLCSALGCDIGDLMTIEKATA